MNLSTQQLLTLQQTANILAVKYPRAAEMVRTGTLPAECVVRLGRQIRVNPDALEQFLQNGGRALEGGWRREALAHGIRTRTIGGAAA
jgi:excisionase family DNA binding protein